jgi:hypothetical protein
VTPPYPIAGASDVSDAPIGHRPEPEVERAAKENLVGFVDVLCSWPRSSGHRDVADEQGRGSGLGKVGW